jgi:hypothetical protein
VEICLKNEKFGKKRVIDIFPIIKQKNVEGNICGKFLGSLEKSGP